VSWILNFSRLTVSQIFDEYKEHPGKDLSEVLLENKAILKRKKTESHSLALEINKVKQHIDFLTKNIKERCSYFNDDIAALEGQVLDEDVFEMLVETKKAKKRYRELVESHQSLGRDISRCADLVQECRKRLLSEFRDWFIAAGGNVDELDSLNLEEDSREVKSASKLSMTATTTTTTTTTIVLPKTDSGAERFYGTRQGVMRRSVTFAQPTLRRASTAPSRRRLMP
jgi:hypothetical protein